jgi:hypothetical protein
MPISIAFWRRDKILTVLLTVSVWVVTTEEDTSFVDVDDLVEPADRLSSGGIAKVLHVDVRSIAPSQDVILGMLSNSDGFSQSSSDLSSLGRVA